jgi:iron complex outermembrane receptor protein
MMTKKLACLASTALVGCLLSATGAMAQSTGSQANEVDSVVVTATGTRAVAGQIVETLPKSRASVDADFLASQSTGQNVFQSLNLLPGVSFTNNDPYGSSGGNLRLRGFDGARVSVTFDGVPLNDTGNYAVYPNQQLDAELIDRASVNLGTTDVDSPTASATGGTINYITRKPSREFGGIATASIGEDNYRRAFLMLDSGEFGPIGTRAFIAGSYQKYDKWKGPGSLEKKQVNARIIQDIGDRGDFVSLAVNYNENRNNNIRQLTLAEFNAFGRNLDYTATCVNRVINAATRTITETAPTVPGNCSDYYGRQVNPSNTGSIRGSALFHLTDNVRLTVDPSFQYTLADGGSQLATIFETDGRVRGTNGAAKDLNGDGDAVDNVAFFAPSVTNTRRYTVTSSLIWDLNEDHRIRVAYTGDYGRHRQTGEYTTLDAQGNPTNVFGGKEGHGDKVLTSDGSFLRARDRFSIAQLNQAAAEYRGKFMDSRLTVNLGLRAPFFKRELNQYCYTQNATGLTSVISGFSVSCTTQAPVVTNTDGTVQFAAGTAANLRYIKPWSATVKYDKVLPNAGASYDIGGGSSVYASYAEGFSSPRTDNLYTATLVNGVGSPADTRPETTKTYDLGYRFSSPTVMATAAIWKTDYKNRIVQAYDPDLNISIDRNVGAVKAYGLDTQAAWALEEYLTVTASFSYNKSEIQEDLVTGAAAGAILPLSGKQVVETPKYTFGGRVDWDVTEAFHVGVQGKYTGDRFSTDVNDEVAPHYAVWDLELRYDLPFAKKTYAQLNVNNLFDETYFGSISSRTNALPITGVSGTGAPTYYIGSPRTVQFTLRTEF